MKRSLSLVLALLLAVAMLLSACAQPAAPQAPTEAGSPAEPETEAEPQAQEVTALIGFTASNTGSLEVPSRGQLNGLRLWLEHVNEAGGVTLDDGTVVKFDEVSYDDESNTDRVQELYTRLATDDEADFLISPYSSGLTDASAVIAEQYGKIMITTGAASDSTYMKGFSLVFQAYTPASAYLTGAADLLANTDAEVKRIAIVHENDKFSTDVSTALNEYALAQGYDVVMFEGYDTGTTDFGPFINKIAQTEPDAIMGGGHFEDGLTFAKQLHEKDVDVNMVTLLVAPPEPEFAEAGEAAVGVIGPSQWEPQANFNAEAAQASGLDWFGISSQEFTDAYVAKYGADPSYHGAGGYAAGLLLQNAIETAGSLDTQAVKTALDNTDALTFFGRIKFDTTPERHGLQTGHSMIYIQWQESNGELVKQVVWPLEGATADIIYPLP